jgi:hypothetical protein
MTSHCRPPAVDTHWLAQLSEEIIDPALPIIDAHHHLWDVAGYPYFLDDLLADLESGHHIGGLCRRKGRAVPRQCAALLSIVLTP